MGLSDILEDAMITGKVPNDLLKEIILDRLKKNRSEVVVRPGIGIDCSAVDFGDNLCVISSDPITGTAYEIGRLAVHINCNDIASCGVEPIGLMAVLLCPTGTSENELQSIMEQLIGEAASINVDLIGGHTEITDAVSRFVITCTAIGRCPRDKLITPKGAKAGDSLVITKHAGLEGASIIAREKETELINHMDIKLINEAKGFIEEISVVREGLMAARFGVNAMHDVTEGGVLGAAWELCEASGKGIEIFTEKIPVKISTRKICEYYNINPYRLISSGCMLMAATDGEGLVNHLRKEGIEAVIIGRLDNSENKLMSSPGGVEAILPPESDELYKVLA
jgi:hydrogenase expression/formation protein HypE